MTVNHHGTLHGIIDGDIVGFSSVIATYENEFASEDAKVITVKYEIGGTDEANYSKPVNNITNYSGFISKATYNMDGIKFDGASLIYDGNAHSLWISGTPHTDVDVFYSNNGKTDAAEHEVIASFSGDTDNYHTIPSKTAILNIQQKEVTVKAHVNDKIYDGNTNTTGGSLLIDSGRVGFDDVSAVGDFRFADVDASGTPKTVNVTGIYLNGAKAGNYWVDPEATTTAMISKKKLTISGTGITTRKLADGTTTAAVISDGTLDGVIPGDSVSVVATATYDSKGVGTNKTITVSYVLGGTHADNYIKLEDSTFIGVIESPGELKAVLTWGATPRDLDFYLKTPDGTKINYRNKKPLGSEASLTEDTTDGYGPETLNINPLQGGTYSFYVNNFSGGGYAHVGAKIEVYYNSVLVKTYLNPISSEGNYWNVFTFTNGIFTVIDQIVFSAPWS